MRGVRGFIPDTPESARAKQARLLGQPAPEPIPAVYDDEPSPESNLPHGYVPAPKTAPIF